MQYTCEVRFFGSLKETRIIAHREWQIHVGQYVTKYEFASIFKHAWTNDTNVENAVKGFKDAGQLQTIEFFNFGPDSVFEKTKKVES